MSILSQIGVVILIIFIILILIRSNKTLEDVAKEGEHFVDEWDLRQQKKAERLLQKEERKSLGRKKGSRQKEAAHQEDDGDWDEADGRENDYGWDEADDRKDDYRWEETDGQGNADSRGIYDKRRRKIEEDYFENRRDYEEEEWERKRTDKIIPMKKYKTPGITLVQMGEDHRPVRRVTVDRIPFQIGRSSQNQLVLDDLRVARMHCRIIEKDGVYLMEDVGTANKLFVNGMTQERVVLTDQLVVYIGNIEFLVEMGMSRSSVTQLYQNARERYYE